MTRILDQFSLRAGRGVEQGSALARAGGDLYKIQLDASRFEVGLQLLPPVPAEEACGYWPFAQRP